MNLKTQIEGYLSEALEAQGLSIAQARQMGFNHKPVKIAIGNTLLASCIFHPEYISQILSINLTSSMASIARNEANTATNEK